MEHPSHKHSLILNENYIAKEGDVCCGCNQQIFSCKSFVFSCSGITCSSTGADTSGYDSVVDSFLERQNPGIPCNKFLLHKSCAELPPHIQNPTNPKDFPNLCFNHSYRDLRNYVYRSPPPPPPPHRCNICGIPLLWKVQQFFYYSSYTRVHICVKCAMFQVESSSSQDTKLIEHAAHSQHPLALIQRPSSFKCDACTMEFDIRDVSYKCPQCPFWMHKTCADAPPTCHFEFHNKHPLTLSYFLPQVYHKFIQYCTLCHKTLSRLDWLYYCPKCRLLAHFRCARSYQKLSSSTENEKYDSDLVHLPAADESTVNLLREQFVKTVSTFRHWAHDEHHLQLITINELIDGKDGDNEIVLLCDGCVKPIHTHEFYACVPCKYFLHKLCAQLPHMIELPDDYWGGVVRLSIKKCSEVYRLFKCRGCGVSCNGIYYQDRWGGNLHIGCATLPKILKHEAHRHQLTQRYASTSACKACGEQVDIIIYKHGCKECDFYICGGCIMKAGTAKHPWDRHPLRLIYEPGMAMEHAHDFNCEFCSQDIDSNFWFYHCTECDLSLHLKDCFERSRYGNCSNVKFGATDINIPKLHPHTLTFVFNDKVRTCKKCHKKLLGEPVLQCAAPCKAMFCTRCC